MYQQALDKVSKQVLIRDRYDNFIGGKWVAPVEGKYFENPSPVTGKRLCQVPRSTSADIELALDAAHKAKDAWGRTSVQERSRILNRIADKIESNLELLALVETLDNGKPIRETTHADKPLAQNKRIAKIAFTGETTTGRMIMQYASDNIIPVTLELGGKSPNIFFADVADEDDDFFDKAMEGFAMFALNQCEVCTCPSRVMVQESIYDKFM